MDIIDHIKQLDKKHGNKLYDLYERNKDYDSVLEFYFGNKNRSERLQFYISELYYKQLEGLLYHRTIDFDQYFMYLQTFFQDLINSNLKPNDDVIVKLNDKLRIKKSFKENEFIFSQATTSLKIKITFIVKFKQLNPQTFIDSQNNIVIELTNITTKNLRHNTYCNKLGSRITPYILGFILVLVVIFSFLANDIINLIQYLFDNSIYSKIAALIFIYCGVIILSPIYNLIEALRRYSKIALSFKINKKYSNTENYLNEFDHEKKQNFTIFENLERALSVPNEDFLGFNLLSASFFYNGIKDSFDPNINLIKIIDAKRGMGKTSFINLLVQRINGVTYRHDADCQLFKDILANKQIKIVQFSIMPFLAALNNSTDDEKKCIDNFIKYIADNLTPASSRYLNAILSSTTAFNDKFNLEKFISQITNSDSIVKIKNNLKLSEQKNLIIIEDLDRLNEKQLQIFVKALWFIYELPFTITLLPCEEKKILASANLSTNVINTYEELEEYKLLQFAFPLKECFYQMLANYTIRLFEDTIKQIEIKNELIQIKQLNENAISKDSIQNDWVSHLYQNKLIKDSGYLSMRLHGSDFIGSIKSEIIHIFEMYNISIREFKVIIGKLHIGTNRLFIVQQILFYMIEYRYKYESGIVEYLNKYDVWGDFKKNHYLTIDQNRLMRNKLDYFTGVIKETIENLEEFPLLNINNGIMSFINAIFGFMNRIHRNYTIKSNNIKSVNIFYCEFISIFLTNSNGGQKLYDNLSLNWHDNLDKLSINCRDEFILLFNQHAETSVSINTEDHKFSYNLFLFQNFAIILLMAVRRNAHNMLDILIGYFNGDMLYNHRISIYNEFYDVKVSFDIDVMIDYYRRLFNIDYNNFEYDQTYQTLDRNYSDLKSKIITGKTDNKFIEVFNKIFIL